MESSLAGVLVTLLTTAAFFVVLYWVVRLAVRGALVDVRAMEVRGDVPRGDGTTGGPGPGAAGS
jgi:hypothetical protein